MKITIECTECGSKVEIVQKEGFPWVNLRPDYNSAAIRINSIDIDNLEIEDGMMVGDDVPAELRSIELRCWNCEHYVTVNF